MTMLHALILIAFCLFRCALQEQPNGLECGNSPGEFNSRTIKVSLNSRRSKMGEWVDTFDARTEAGISSKYLHLDLTHRVIDCNDKRIVYVKGVATDLSVEEHEGKLLFHSRCGKNVAIVNKGHTAQKINLNDAYNAVVFTSRPLRNDEIFEVRLDKKISKLNNALGIAVSTSSPVDGDIVPQIYQSPHAWVYHHNHIYHNSKEFLNNYGPNINDLKVGDRIGVMRSEFGTLHFFVNGVDQGPAASNIPHPVYGVLDLWRDAVKATIVEAANNASSS